EAMAAGRNQPARTAAQPNAEDIARLDAALRANGTPSIAYEMLTGTRAPDQATPRIICDAETHFVRATRSLPSEQGHRI
ncbi:hypothetical protein ABTD55_23720, partial [Acinetobacter baumannii]